MGFVRVTERLAWLRGIVGRTGRILCGLGEAKLLGLQRVVPEGGDPDEAVALLLAGLAELHVERLSGLRDHGAVG